MPGTPRTHKVPETVVGEARGTWIRMSQQEGAEHGLSRTVGNW
jgi:hypothetical protein